MSLWRRFTSRRDADAHAPSELDACLNLLSSTPPGRGRSTDLTQAILARAGAHMPLVTGRRLRLLSAGRVVIGLGLALSIAVGALTLHAWRDEASMRGILGQSAPASQAMASAVDGVNGALRGVTSAGRSVRQFNPATLLATIEAPAMHTVHAAPAERSAAPAPSRPVQVAALTMLRGPTGATVLAPAPARTSANLGVLDRVLPARAPRDLAECVAQQLHCPAAVGANAADLPMPR